MLSTDQMSNRSKLQRALRHLERMATIAICLPDGAIILTSTGNELGGRGRTTRRLDDDVVRYAHAA